VAYLPLCPGQAQVHVDLTVLPHSSVVVLEESPCPRGSSRTSFQVLVFESQVLANNTVSVYSCVNDNQLTAVLVLRGVSS